MRELDTERLHLRYVTADDTLRIYQCWASDAEVTRYLTWHAHKNIRVTVDYVAYVINEYKKPDTYRWGIVIRETNELIGIIDVVGYHHGDPVIGYCSGRDYWGNGYMTEALKAVTAALFEDGFETIVIEAVDRNIGSNRVIEKAGFKFVGSRVAPLSEIKKDELVKLNSYRLYKSR
ncbi:MAG: GNAT family N-acetyltransferase [Ruminococcus sp.]|nr:GNAT family N-acetyltransferase [Ruminococcus sp.]